jgi:HSP20 family protein
MIWTWPTRRYTSPWDEMDRLQRELNRLFEPFSRTTQRALGEFPAVNIWMGDDTALLTAEIPGVDPASVEVSVKDDTVTIRGRREAEPLRKGEALLRQERGAGEFVRSFALPFHVDPANVTAQYRYGILQVTLPRAEADKPRRIKVNAA